LNEMLRGALLKAQISEEDVAACLEVDPKTVRRWLEGRIPYLRHRWALASMLGLDESDLWPEASTVRKRPDELRAVYPNRDAVSNELWVSFFASAIREIDILADSGAFLVEDPRIVATLHDRAQAAVQTRICVRDRDTLGSHDAATGSRDALAPYGRLRDRGSVEIRLHRIILSNTLYRVDDELLIGQRAFGVPDRQTPLLYLHKTDESDIFETYIASYDRIWVSALSVGQWTRHRTVQ
jgi:transcriptional regulator with XRE-family HTH domain